jgi:hypothetical protein
LRKKEKQREHIHITFIVIYCYNYSTVLLVIINILLCLIYKLNFITSMHIELKNIAVQHPVLSAVWSSHWGSLLPYSLWWEETTIHKEHLQYIEYYEMVIHYCYYKWYHITSCLYTYICEMNNQKCNFWTNKYINY